MLELFARPLDALSLNEGAHLTPIPMDGEISSLSAILLDVDYYDLIRSGRSYIEGLPVVTATHLIPLKAKAWLDLSERRAAGDPVDERTVRKHRNDVFRLYQIVPPDQSILLPKSVKMDLYTFLSRMETEPNIDLKNLGLRNTRLADVINTLGAIYAIDGD